MKASIGVGVGPVRVTQPLGTSGVRTLHTKSKGFVARHPLIGMLVTLGWCGAFVPERHTDTFVNVWFVAVAVTFVAWVIWKVKR